MWTERLFDGLQVDTGRMAANLQAHLDELTPSEMAVEPLKFVKGQ